MSLAGKMCDSTSQQLTANNQVFVSLTSVTGPMIPMKTPIALHALLSFSYQFFTHYTVIANRFHFCCSLV